MSGLKFTKLGVAPKFSIINYYVCIVIVIFISIELVIKENYNKI